MLDTIVLLIDSGQFSVTDYDKFTPSARGLFQPPYIGMGAKGAVRCIQNPSKEDIQAGNYKPRLTLIKSARRGGYSLQLKIDFSVPKLIWGNNFQELGEGDFARAIKAITETLKLMGVDVDPHKLAEAEISAIHFSKNILIEDHVTASMVIRELEKINPFSRLDTTKSRFRNDGQALQYHCNDYEVAFYDKLRDLEQAKISEKRALEKDNYCQKTFFRNGVIREDLEVLRMEVRINSKTKLRELLSQLNFDGSVRFGDLFSESKAKSILCHFWKIIMQGHYPHSLEVCRAEDFIERAIKQGFTPAKAMQCYGVFSLIQSVGMRLGRQILGVPPRTLKKMFKEIQALGLAADQRFWGMQQVTKALYEFIPINLTERKVV